MASCMLVAAALLAGATIASGCTSATSPTLLPSSTPTLTNTAKPATLTPTAPALAKKPSPSDTPTPSPTPSSTRSPSASPSPPSTATPSRTQTPLPTPTHSPTAVPTLTPSVTPTSSPTTTAFAAPSPTVAATTAAVILVADIRITEVFFDGKERYYEGDEYVEVANCGEVEQELEGWVLLDVDDGGPSFEFPAYTLHPGYSVRVYTDYIHDDYGGFSFGSDSAIWNNSSPDLAELRDADGNAVSQRGYEPWSGCD